MVVRYSMFLVCFLAVGTLQAGDEKNKMVLAKWKGSVPNLELLKKKPKGGVIADEETRKAIWNAWRVKKGKVTEFDFEKQVMVISTTRGSVLKSMANLTPKGDLRVVAMSTRDLRPGFRYEILLLSRDGVKTVNGKKLTEQDE